MGEDKIYAGIGSRRTPADVLSVMTQIARELDMIGYTLRSGGAPGADLAFELGSTKKEIYLPWANFNASESTLYTVCEGAMDMASHYHPAWSKLSSPVRKLMARNCYQVLGLNLNEPVKFVVCWTPDGRSVGGTAQAIRIAKDWKIPVFNLHRHSPRDILAFAGKNALF
jgi:hypothetical protein